MFWLHALQEVRVFCYNHMGWNVGLPFWTWNQAAVDGIPPHYISEEERIWVCAVQKKIPGYRLLKWERFLNFLPMGATMKLYWNTSNSQCLPLSSSSYKQNFRSVAPPWQHLAQHKCSHQWDHHRIWMDTVAIPTLESWTWTNRFSPVWSFKKTACGNMRTHWHAWQGTAELHAPVAAEEGEQLLPGRNTCFSSNVEEDCWQGWRLYWNFTHLIVAWNRKEGHYFLMNLCINLLEP